MILDTKYLIIVSIRSAMSYRPCPLAFPLSCSASTFDIEDSTVPAGEPRVRRRRKGTISLKVHTAFLFLIFLIIVVILFKCSFAADGILGEEASS